jgi:hypothetical protein
MRSKFKLGAEIVPIGKLKYFCMADTRDERDPPPNAKSWQFYSIPMFLGAGWIIYEVSHSPDIAAMVMCLKFGIEDFRTAVWLRRKDPWSTRGRATGMLYLASGMWKAAIAGIAMVFAILVVLTLTKIGGIGNGAIGVNGANNPNAAARAFRDIQAMIVAAFGATLIGQAIACLACARALSIARTYHIPLWLSSSLHYARSRDDWPPLYGYLNRIGWLNGCCFLFNWLIFVPFLSLFIGRLVNELFNLQLPMGLFLFVFFFGYLHRAIVLGNKHQELGLFARHPSQCWEASTSEETKVDGDEEEKLSVIT